MDSASNSPSPTAVELDLLAARLRAWARELGFQALGITGTDLTQDELRLMDWLAAGRHGTMGYMARHGCRRSRPGRLVPGTIRVISVRMDYLPPRAAPPGAVLDSAELGYVSRYALGRDYHRLMRRRLQRLADRACDMVGDFGYRVFVDSAPVLEKALARNAGLGWIGKHTNLLSRDAGSWFFLGEIYTDLPLPLDQPGQSHCGRCRACLDACPTGAIVAPYQLDARRCISYLTIEHDGPIPLELRVPMGNRIYGCDDCQLVCPWNRFAAPTREADFAPRHRLDGARLTELFAWSEAEFRCRTEGMAIRRIGYERWLRNIAVALGNAPHDPEVVRALRSRLEDAPPMVREHIRWALGRHRGATCDRDREPDRDMETAKQ